MTSLIIQIWQIFVQLTTLVSESLDNREIMTMFWLGVFLIWAWSKNKKGITRSFVRVGKMLFEPKILIPLLLSIGFFFVAVRLVQLIGFWAPSLWKDGIVWYFTIGIGSLFTANKALNDNDYFKKLFISLIKMDVFLVFYLQLFVFPLYVEFFFVPFMMILVALQAYSQISEQYESVTKFLNTVLTLVGIFLFYYTIKSTVNTPAEAFSISNVFAFTLPILLTVFYMPYIYLFVVMMAYENTFLRLHIWFNYEKIKWSIKYKIFLCCGFRLSSINAFYERIISDHVRSEQDLFNTIRAFKST